MATTKVGGGVVDLNSDNTAFKMPVGSGYFTGTPVTGMIRNNSSVSSGGSSTAFEFYDGTTWVGMVNSPLPPYAADYLVVGAGGGSGSYGGGGAGGYQSNFGGTAITLNPSTTYTITIGGGGVTSPNSSTAGDNGSPSILSGSDITDITSIGGGYGGNLVSGINANSGASGGGGASDGAGAGGAGTSGQGNAGGSGAASHPNYSGGGGGGAGAVGNAGSGSAGGNGGVGLQTSITGTGTYFAGGGGGTGYAYPNPGTSGTGGNRGGGTANPYGSTNTNSNGLDNTGGGGGGNGAVYSNGKGGSGIVILRVPTANYSGTTTGSPTITTDGTDTIISFTGSGTYTA